MGRGMHERERERERERIGHVIRVNEQWRAHEGGEGGGAGTSPAPAPSGEGSEHTKHGTNGYGDTHVEMGWEMRHRWH